MNIWTFWITAYVSRWAASHSEKSYPLPSLGCLALCPSMVPRFFYHFFTCLFKTSKEVAFQFRPSAIETHFCCCCSHESLSSAGMSDENVETLSSSLSQLPPPSLAKSRAVDQGSENLVFLEKSNPTLNRLHSSPSLRPLSKLGTFNGMCWIHRYIQGMKLLQACAPKIQPDRLDTMINGLKAPKKARRIGTASI